MMWSISGTLLSTSAKSPRIESQRSASVIASMISSSGLACIGEATIVAVVGGGEATKVAVVDAGDSKWSRVGEPKRNGAGIVSSSVRCE